MNDNKLLGLDADTDPESCVIQGGRIAMWGMRAPQTSNVGERLDCRGAAIVPGFVNAHTHLYSALAPLGMPRPKEEPKGFLEILQKVWWRLDKAMDARAMRAGARMYAAEALLAGTTTLFDHHESPGFIDGCLDVLAEACDEIGIRAVLCYGATERNKGREEAKKGLAECERFLQKNRRGLVTGMVGLHAGFTASDETLREAGELARRLHTAIHVHVAEDQMDVDHAKERGYAGPLERLRELGALVPGSVLAHGVHLSEAQVKAAVAAGAWIVHNPRSNAGNKVGCAHLTAAFGSVALGTDGYPGDMLEEMAGWARIAEKDPSSEKPDARRLAAGQKLAGERFGARFAPPAAGAAADLVVLEPPVGEGKAKIRHVVVDGRVVVKNRTLVSGDLDVIRGEAAVEAQRIWKRLV